MSATRPRAWNTIHDIFLIAYADLDEDPRAIALLLENQFPILQHVSAAWVVIRLAELGFLEVDDEDDEDEEGF